MITGGILHEALATTASGVRGAGAVASVLAPTRLFGNLRATQTLETGRRANVFAVGSIALARGQTLTISGAPGAEVVVNVTGRFRLRGRSAIAVAGGPVPGRVVLNAVGHGPPVVLAGGSRATGTILALDRAIVLNGKGTRVSGGIVGGRRITIAGGAHVSAAP